MLRLTLPPPWAKATQARLLPRAAGGLFLCRRRANESKCGARKAPQGPPRPPPTAPRTPTARREMREALIIAKRPGNATERPPSVDPWDGLAIPWDGSTIPWARMDDNTACFQREMGLFGAKNSRIFAKTALRPGPLYAAKTPNGGRQRTGRGTPAAKHGRPAATKANKP